MTNVSNADITETGDCGATTTTPVPTPPPYP
jgi:hypothetical protein